MSSPSLKAAALKAGVSQAELEQAAELYHDFRERDVGLVTKQPIDWPRVSVAIGKIRAIEYHTTHDEEHVLYRHDFKRWAWPDFQVSTDGRHLLILPGNFVFTERGIVDTRTPGRRGSRSK